MCLGKLISIVSDLRVVRSDTSLIVIQLLLSKSATDGFLIQTFGVLFLQISESLC